MMVKQYRLPVAAALLLLLLVLVGALCIGCETADEPHETREETIPAATVAEGESADEPTSGEDTTVTEIQTEADTTTEAVTTEAVTTEAADTVPVAGMDSGVVRDGTPKKYITIRLDDGITQDARIIELLKTYGVDACTFYINTGLVGANWAWVGQSFNRPDVTHIRYTRDELMTGIYDGFDVEVHTLTHPSLKDLTDRNVTRQVKRDAQNITDWLGCRPVGMAWPGGDTEWNEHNIEVILETTDIRYGSCTTRTGTFALPTYFMTWYPTCSLSDSDLMDLAERFVAVEPTEDMLFYVWGHGYEFDIFDTWDRLETFIRYISEAAAADDSIVLVTNAEFYQLFKDEIPSWKE